MTHLHVDLCCGLGGWQQPFRDSPQWRSAGLDVRRDLDPDVQADVRELPLRPCEPTLVTASPPCTEFSRWRMPWYPDEEPDLTLANACFDAIEKLNPEWWILENVQGFHDWFGWPQKQVGPWWLWGEFPPFDLDRPKKRKYKLWGDQPDQRALIPPLLAKSVKKAVEWYL